MERHEKCFCCGKNFGSKPYLVFDLPLGDEVAEISCCDKIECRLDLMGYMKGIQRTFEHFMKILPQTTIEGQIISEKEAEYLKALYIEDMKEFAETGVFGLLKCYQWRTRLTAGLGRGINKLTKQRGANKDEV